MIEEFVELLRELDKGSWVEIEKHEKWPDYVGIDGHFEVAKIESWLAEVKAQAVEKAANRESDWRSGYWRPAEAETVVKIRKGLLKHAQRIRQGEEQ